MTDSAAGQPAGPSAPTSLRRLQQGFAQSIRTPLQIDADGYSYGLEHYDPDVVASMMASSRLAGIERLSVYNQQYWFRLLSVLQSEFPLLRHRLGIVDFNRLATAYLDAYPSQHPELHHLPERMDAFLAGEHQWNTPLLRQSARCDYLYNRVFFATKQHDFDGRTLSDEQLGALLTRPLPFQSAWYLFAEDWNHVVQRPFAAKDDDDELELEPEERVGYWVIYRSSVSGVAEEELSGLQYRLLSLLAAGRSLSDACEQLAADCDPNEMQVLAAGIQDWFKRWAGLGWFRAL